VIELGISPDQDLSVEQAAALASRRGYPRGIVLCFDEDDNCASLNFGPTTNADALWLAVWLQKTTQECMTGVNDED
jgi:hypothetical protein